MKVAIGYERASEYDSIENRFMMGLLCLMLIYYLYMYVFVQRCDD